MDAIHILLSISSSLSPPVSPFLPFSALEKSRDSRTDTVATSEQAVFTKFQSGVFLDVLV